MFIHLKELSTTTFKNYLAKNDDTFVTELSDFVKELKIDGLDLSWVNLSDLISIENREWMFDLIEAILLIFEITTTNS